MPTDAENITDPTKASKKVVPIRLSIPRASEINPDTPGAIANPQI